jgi:hypothetical protein
MRLSSVWLRLQHRYASTTGLSMFLAVVTMLFVIVPMVLAPVAMFVAVIAVLIAVIGMISVVLTILGNVGIVIPIISNKVDRLATGVVFAAMWMPIPFMSGPYVKIDRGWQRFVGTSYHRRSAA